MWRKGLRSILLFLLALLVMSAAAWPAYADLWDEYNDRVRESEALSRQLEAERQKLQQQLGKQKALEAEIDQLDRRIKELEAEIKRLEGEIKQTEEEIAATEAELAEAQENLDYRDSMLKARLRAIHEQGTVTYLEVLLNSTSFSDFLSRLNNLKIIAEKDRQLLEDVTVERNRIKEEKEALEVRKSELEVMRRQAQANEEEVERTKASREAAHHELAALIAEQEAAIAAMEEEKANIDRMIDEILAQLADDGTLNGFNGKIRWPIEGNLGYISSPFGTRRNPHYPHYSSNPYQTHYGIDIATPVNRWPLSPYYIGTPAYIRAVETGRVIFSGISEGGGVTYQKEKGRDEFRNPQYWTYPGAYGSLIIIDHGKGYVSVYAHCHARHVNTGQYVTKGSIIGIVGSTGSSYGPHLHFEVRHNGVYKNPVSYGWQW